MNNEKQVRPIGDAKKYERIPREKSENISANSDDIIDKVLKEMNEETKDDEVISGETEKENLTVTSGK